jgi:cysteine desulfurase/selenocysteine lyase
LPDESELARIASRLFQALPGDEPPATAAAVTAVPDVPAPGVVAAPLAHGVSGRSTPAHGVGGAPAPMDVPAAEPPPSTPVTGMSGPAGPPPTSAPANYLGFATRNAGPTPELPMGQTGLELPEPDQLTNGQYYFLTDAAGYTPSAPATPGFALPAPPPSMASAAPARTSSPFYFLAEPESVPALPVDPHPPFDVQAVRRDFPILSERVNGRPLIWLDNAATTQKPRAVIDRLVEFYSRENSNIHRAAHELAARATDAYEGARKTVARFLGANSHEEIVFVRGTTEAINLVAKAWGGRHIGAGDEIVISHLEHHANIVPWQMLAEQTGAVIKVIPVDDDGQLLLEEYQKLLSERTKLVSVTHVSNALGTVVPVDRVIDLAHRAGARVLVDAAQSVPHVPIDVSALDADFLAFSGHKIFGPTGIGALYGKPEVLEEMPPWEGGGNMIADVTLERSTFQPPPGRFEAGTGNIADAVGLGAALDYVERVGLPNIAAYEHQLLEYATARLREVPGLRLIGTAAEKASVVSFLLDGYTPTEVGAALNEDGIAVRAGHHCAQPILRRYGLEATVRPSLAFYNTHEEVDTLASAVHRLAANRR